MSTTEPRTGFRLPWGGDTRRSEPAGEAPGDPGEAPEADGEAAEIREGAPDVGSAAGPDAGSPVDQGVGSPVTETADPPTHIRRDNPLIVGLVRAMREAAETARVEAASRAAAASTARVEALRTASAEEASAIRKDAEGEILAIREWSKAEMARIKELTERRIGDRREALESDMEAHAAGVEHQIEAVHAAVAAFEARMADFFERLLAEEDPARLATFAEQMPEPPDLEAVAPPAPAPTARARGTARGRAVLQADDAAAAEAEALAALDPAADGAAGSEPDHDLSTRLAMLTTPLPYTRETPAEDRGTRVAVVGLVSVASISVFKRSLARLPEVRSVSVTSGPDGDFVFSVTHGPDLDLSTALETMTSFDIKVTTGADGSLAVVAHDPEG
jgi:hypothetical protein